MDSTTTSAPRIEPGRAAARRAFTLAEVLLATALSGFVLAAVLSAFLFLGRTGLRASGASEMENQVRRALETFAEEARLATDIRWNSAQSVTFTLPAGSPATQVTYAYDADPRSATYQAFYRLVGDAASTAPRRALVRGVAADFSFRRYKLEQTGVSDNAAANDAETKQIQIVLRAERTHAITAGASQSVASARFILRNKRVSN
jgi:type II secretory pathway pseudopilin PulG